MRTQTNNDPTHGNSSTVSFNVNFLLHFQTPKGRHFDDVNLLEFTVDYLKQTADFQRGVGLCAEETKAFLKQHIFDRRKMNVLLQKLEQRIDFVSRQQSTACNDAFQRDRVFDQVTDSTDGVLLDLRMKQNRLRDATSRSNTSTSTTNNVCKQLRKREILDKIRQKILDKRRMSDITSLKVEVVQHNSMWRPWRY